MKNCKQINQRQRVNHVRLNTYVIARVAWQSQTFAIATFHFSTRRYRERCIRNDIS
ncbi:hypothetical protein [Nostoc sp.]|uniref:hypothetical protein n=1 Tax=Nostoc sp. TaxID=1180 RepID=UPI002A5CB730|nr:hypothetical protein [Nostoc sp. S13]